MNEVDNEEVMDNTESEESAPPRRMSKRLRSLKKQGLPEKGTGNRNKVFINYEDNKSGREIKGEQYTKGLKGLQSLQDFPPFSTTSAIPSNSIQDIQDIQSIQILGEESSPFRKSDTEMYNSSATTNERNEKNAKSPLAITVR